MKNSICTQCTTNFEITSEDKDFYSKISPVYQNQKFQIPEPTLCPDCRRQRRLVWRNEWKLYHQNCDLCASKIISMYRPEVSFPVYCLDCWWSDKWNAFDYGRDFDFNRPFFEQFAELRDQVPHFSLAVLRSTMENSDFCNHAGYLKNCYLLVNSDESENCLYGKAVNKCFDCMDCFNISNCEGCYEAIDSTNCHECSHIIDCHTSNNCHFSANLTGCKNCFLSANLHNKEHYFLNKKLSPEEYTKKVKNLLNTHTHQQIWQKFLEFRRTQPQKWMREKHTEDCTGDSLIQAKNCHDCYDSQFMENCKHCSGLKAADKISFDNHDISYFGLGVQSSYECSVIGYNANHLLFCENVWNSSDVLYSQLCDATSNLFGCIGMRHGKYAILNKQYSKEEYEKLVPKIINHMQETGEWGQFFPHQMSAFGYTETVAHEFNPLTKEQAQSKGWNWHDEKDPDYSNISRKITSSKLPTKPGKIPDEILNWAIHCETSNRLYKIQKLELEFYRKRNLPVPQLHPEQRHRQRFLLRNPQKLWTRQCHNCTKEIKTSFSPNRPETIFCQECYLQAVT